MNISSENLDPESYRLSLSKEGVQHSQVAFSSKVNKFNRHGKVNERVLVVTPNQLIKMDPAKKFKVMLNVSLSDVKSISLSPDAGNQLVLIGFSQTSGQNDLIMSLVSAKGEDLVGEVVGVLASSLNRLGAPPLPVKVSNVLQFQSGKKVQAITINARPLTDNNNPQDQGTTGGGNLSSQFIKSKGGGVVYTALTAAN